MILNAVIVVRPTWPPPKDCSHFIKEKLIQVIKSEKARRLASASNVQGSSQSCANATKKVSVSVATQTSITWPTGDTDPSAVDQITSQIQLKTTKFIRKLIQPRQSQLKKQPQTKTKKPKIKQTRRLKCHLVRRFALPRPHGMLFKRSSLNSH